MLWDVPGCSEALAVVLTRTFYLQNLVSHLFRLIHNVTPDHTSACLIFHEERTSDKGLKHIGGGANFYMRLLVHRHVKLGLPGTKKPHTNKQ